MTEAKNFRTRFAVLVADEDGREIQVTPVDSLVINLNTPKNVIHSTEDSNLGYSRGPPAFSFTISVMNVGEAVLELTRLQLQEKEFSVITQVAGDTPEDWSFADDGITLNRCVLVSSDPTVQWGTHIMRFGGLALGVEIGGEEYS